MTSRAGDAVVGDRRLRWVLARASGAAVSILLLAGCASGASPGATPSPSASACAVAANPNGPPPEGCIVYDPEENMAANQRYRDRYEIGADVADAGAPYAASVRAGLGELRDSAHITADAVREVLHDSGLSATSIQTIGDVGAVEFGAMMPTEVGGPDVGVCLFGEVSADRLAVEVGGVVMDGGCVPSRGGH